MHAAGDLIADEFRRFLAEVTGDGHVPKLFVFANNLDRRVTWIAG
jgi:hypothetical protein